MIAKISLITTFFIATSSAWASTLTCFKAGGPVRGRLPIATVTYDQSVSERGSLEAFGELYENLELKFTATGQFVHGSVPGLVDFRIQSLMPLPNAMIYAKLSFPNGSTSENAGQTHSLMCARSN